MSRVFSLIVVFAALLVLASAQSSSSTGGATTSSSSGGATSTAPVTGSLTICQNYSTGGASSTAAAQIALMNAIVTRAAIGTNGTAVLGYVVSGLFNSSGPLYNIFSGRTQYRTGAPDYTTSASDQATLVTHLIGYFGAAFGCTAVGFTPVNNPDMYAVHANMFINNTMETYFNQQLAYTLLSLGVDPAVVNYAAAPFLQKFYQCAPPIAAISPTARVQICGSSDCGYGGTGSTASASTCAQYTTGAAAAQYGASALMVVVLAVISALLL